MSGLDRHRSLIVFSSARLDPTAGVFETIRVHGGVPVALDAHLRRLTASCLTLYGQPPGPDARELVTREAAGLTGQHRLRLDARPQATGLELTVRTSAWSPHTGGLTLLPSVVAGGLGPHKWADRSQLRRPVDPQQALLLLDEHGAVLECDIASVFVVIAGQVRTPPLDNRILPGTARARVLATLRTRGRAAAEVPVSTEELVTAAEVFLTNALRGVVPVVAVEGLRASGPAGPVTTWLQRQVR